MSNQIKIAKQVEFYDSKKKDFLWGIEYDDVVICTCCGYVIPVAQIYENAANDGITSPAIIRHDYWVDFSDYIA